MKFRVVIEEGFHRSAVIEATDAKKAREIADAANWNEWEIDSNYGSYAEVREIVIVDEEPLT